MTRRGFLGMLAGGLAAAADPERLLWVPGRRLISIPPPPLSPYDVVIEAGPSFLTPQVFQQEILRMLERNLQICHAVNSAFAPEFERAADRAERRIPRRFARMIVGAQ